MTTKSRFGVWSLLIWGGVLVMGGIVLAVFFYMAVLSGRNANLPGDTFQGVVTTLFGGAIIASPIAHLVGLVLGIVGAIRREPRWIITTLGIVLNGLAILGLILMGLLAWLGISV